MISRFINLRLLVMTSYGKRMLLAVQVENSKKMKVNELHPPAEVTPQFTETLQSITNAPESEDVLENQSVENERDLLNKTNVASKKTIEKPKLNRRRMAMPSRWKKNIRRDSRLNGKEYLSCKEVKKRSKFAHFVICEMLK